MNVVDSSGWLAFFAGDPTADFFAPALLDTGALLVPTLSIHEVFKIMTRQRGEKVAIEAVAAMRSGRVVALSEEIALSAARLCLQRKLPMADGIMLATAHAHDATFWTQDADFAHIEGVRYTAAKRP